MLPHAPTNFEQNHTVSFWVKIQEPPKTGFWILTQKLTVWFWSSYTFFVAHDMPEQRSVTIFDGLPPSWDMGQNVSTIQYQEPVEILVSTYVKNFRFVHLKINVSKNIVYSSDNVWNPEKNSIGS